MLFAKVSGCPYDVPHFLRGALFIIDAAVGKTAETAIGIKEYLFGTEIFQRPLGIMNDGLDAFDLLRPRINNAKADFTIRKRFPHYVHVARPRRCIFENKLSYADFLKTGDQRFVISGKKHFFGSAPVAAADVETCPRALDSLDDPIEKLSRIFQLGTRIPAGGQRRSHEGSPFVFF
jgi:hypothetical protein